MSNKTTYFISDIHLGAKYITSPREHEMRVVNWLDSIKDSADKIFLLGDILDYWFEYKNVVPRGFVRFFGKLAELADSGIEITWLIGNHDIWIFDYLPNELGITVTEGPITVDIKGKKFLLDHGDHVGKHPLPYRVMRSTFHNRFCQWLYASVHPRWTVAFATKWSNDNRTGRNENDVTIETNRGIKILTDFSEKHSASNPEIDYYVYGHLHTMLQHKLHTGKEMFVIGEWISTCSYAAFDGETLTLNKIQ